MQPADLIRARAFAEKLSSNPTVPMPVSMNEVDNMAAAILQLTDKVFPSLDLPITPPEVSALPDVVPVAQVRPSWIFPLLEVPTMKFLGQLPKVLSTDLWGLFKTARSYGNSWKSRGGVGAFMMLARKWDRLEIRIKEPAYTYDIFKAIREDTRREGVIDDVRDLRRYLALVEAECIEQGWILPETATKDNAVRSPIVSDDAIDGSTH